MLSVMAVPDASTGPAGEAGALKDTLHDLLWEVTAYSEMLGEAALADTPLTLPSNGMLETIVREPGVTVAEVSRRLPKSQQAISQVVARLERLGFVERRVGAGRGVGLYATEAGLAASREGVARERAFETQLREILGPERFAALRELLLASRESLRQPR